MPGRARGPPRILYHGTCKGYVEQQLRKGSQYSHHKDSVHLTTIAGNAVSYAYQRGETYCDDPVVLVVDVKRLCSCVRTALAVGENCTVPFLNEKSFVMYPLDTLPPNEMIDNEEIRKVAKIGQAMLEGIL